MGLVVHMANSTLPKPRVTLHSAETKELGAIIDLANSTVSFRTLGVENLPLIKTS